MSKYDRNALKKKMDAKRKREDDREWFREQHRRQHPGLYED